MINKKKVIEHQYFWIALAVIVILILVSLVDSVHTGAATSEQGLDYAFQKVAYEPAGGELYFEANVNGVKSIQVHFAEIVKDMTIKVEELSKVKWFKGDAYSYFKISSDDNKKISSWEITLKIKETDLKKVWLKKNEVKIYANGKELATTIDHEEEGYIFYKATSKEAGEFVIGKATPVVVPVVKEKAKSVEVAKPVEEIKPIVEEAVVGKAIEQPTTVAAEEGVWAKVKVFFKGLWK